MKVIISADYITTVNRLPSIPMFWDSNHFVGNAGIQNIFGRTRYQVVLQNNHFADNTKQDKTDKDYKIPIIKHLNESLQTAFSNEPEQCIDEYKTKFKVRSCFLFQALQQRHGWCRYNGSKNGCLQTRSKRKYRFYLKYVFLSHGCHTCKQSYFLYETWC